MSRSRDVSENVFNILDFRTHSGSSTVITSIFFPVNACKNFKQQVSKGRGEENREHHSIAIVDNKKIRRGCVVSKNFGIT